MNPLKNDSCMPSLQRRALVTSLLTTGLAQPWAARAAGPGGRGASFNPIANADQRAAEDQALRVFASPALREGLKRVASQWRLAYGENASEQAWSLFDGAMEENAFNYTLKAAASDGNHPRPVRVFMPPHQWEGRNVPGSRIGGDNPDNCYRLIGIHPGARYELQGKPAGPVPGSITFTLVANWGTSKTIQTIDYTELQKAQDGSFTIVIDDQPANGRRNHLRSRPDVKFLFIRDSLQDWSTQTPLDLAVRRIDPPDAAPLTDAQVAERAVAPMIDDVPLYYWFTRLFSGRPVNTMNAPVGSGAVGGLVTQAGSQGWFKLQQNDAYVFRINQADAGYCSVVAHDWWLRSVNYWQRTGSFTTAMMTPNADGSFSAVLSLRDPGVHNWIDPGGLHEVPMLVRWQGLPAQRVRQGPQIAVQHVRFDDLGSMLPPETVAVTPAARRLQLEQRAAGFARRLAHA